MENLKSVIAILFIALFIGQSVIAEDRIATTYWDGLKLVRYQHDSWFVETTGVYEKTSSETEERVTLAGRWWLYPLIEKKLFAVGELGAVFHTAKWKSDTGARDNDISAMVSLGLMYHYKRFYFGAGGRCSRTKVDNDKTGDSRKLCGPIISFSVGF